MIETKITEMLGIKYPIIQGGMQWLSRAELAASVSNAGGLGIITSANYDSGQELREEIRKTKELTDKPFGVNISLFAHRPLPTDEYIDVVIEESESVILWIRHYCIGFWIVLQPIHPLPIDIQNRFLGSQFDNGCFCRGRGCRWFGSGSHGWFGCG